MHEYSIVQALVGQVAEQVAQRPGAEVRRLTVKVGELSGVEIDLLQTAYDTFKAHSICQDAELVIEAVPACWSCPDCAVEVPSGGVLRCPSCQRPARLQQGDEIILQRIEMEIPDV